MYLGDLQNCMMTSSNGKNFRVTGPLCGEFTGPGEFPTQRPVTRSVDVFFDLRLNKRLSKQPWVWWFETPSWSLWRQCNGLDFGNCLLIFLILASYSPCETGQIGGFLAFSWKRIRGMAYNLTCWYILVNTRNDLILVTFLFLAPLDLWNGSNLGFQEFLKNAFEAYNFSCWFTLETLRTG